jgi:hypothetical protein
MKRGASAPLRRPAYSIGYFYGEGKVFEITLKPPHCPHRLLCFPTLARPRIARGSARKGWL